MRLPAPGPALGEAGRGKEETGRPEKAPVLASSVESDRLPLGPPRRVLRMLGWSSFGCKGVPLKGRRDCKRGRERERERERESRRRVDRLSSGSLPRGTGRGVIARKPALPPEGAVPSLSRRTGRGARAGDIFPRPEPTCVGPGRRGEGPLRNPPLGPAGRCLGRGRGGRPLNLSDHQCQWSPMSVITGEAEGSGAGMNRRPPCIRGITDPTRITKFQPDPFVGLDLEG